uniref:ABI gene family member 3 n=1 Tax=Terrapene triunguis TaxID=2587831 RepID=A0A674ITI7_9SAUR
MSELQKLQQTEIPSARQVLRENYSKLHKVADYCENNYMQATDKRKALEETMAYSAQSLASVAYQISNLASNVLQLLDLHASELHQVEANICCVAQMVDVHKEKVARREIGTLTVCKRPPHYQKIIYPTYQEPLEAYYRKPLNFSILDDVGHGIKVRINPKDGLKHLMGWTSPTGHNLPTPCFSSTAGIHSLSLVTYDSMSLSLIYTHNSSSGAAGNFNAKVPVAQLMPPSVPPPLDLDTMPPPPPPVDMPEPPPIGFEMPLPDVPPPFSMPGLEPQPMYFHNEPGSISFLPSHSELLLRLAVVTLYPYTQQKENELSFPEGAVIYMTRKHSDGWCEGVTSEAEGFFPGNYVEPFCR